MKRGLIAWNRTELPQSAFNSRAVALNKILATSNLPALVVYTDVWRSNQARYFSNVMPYWNRALLVASRELPPTLLCGLSPRVYPWIRSVTTLEDIRPGGNLAETLLQLCRERLWRSIGVLDFSRLPEEIYAPLAASGIEIGNVAWSAIHSAPDEAEMAMYRRAAALAREVLSEELARAAGKHDFAFVAALERRLRRGGAEDLVVLLSNGQRPPAPASGAALADEFSVTLGLEYRGHWIRLSRSSASKETAAALSSQFQEQLKTGFASGSDAAVFIERLSGVYPYETCTAADLCEGDLFSAHIEMRRGDCRLFHGDACLQGKSGPELL